MAKRRTTAINVLVFPAGETNAIELHDALATCVNINLYGASSKERHGRFVFENYTAGLPLITDASFLTEFNSFLVEKKIDVIFPTHDTVALFMAENRKRIKARVLVSDVKTAEICRDKIKTYALFSDCPFCPAVYDAPPYPYPVFVKPKNGQGGVGARLVARSEDLSANLEDFVVCEYLPGEEYTVDCLTDAHGKLLVVSPRSRLRLMAGVCVSGQTEAVSPEIAEIAETLNRRLSFVGLWYFQIKKNADGNWKLLEISARCASSMCLTRVRGLNLPLLSVYAAMGYDVTAEPNAVGITMDRALISRYKIDYHYETVYFDFDDTLTVRGKVNLRAIWFLYQCRNWCKKVVLLTKHERELADSMARYAIHPALFDEIVHIAPEEHKADHINPQNAIFIDNAYQERADVYRRHGIPVFDVDAIEVLMDWRI